MAKARRDPGEARGAAPPSRRSWLLAGAAFTVVLVVLLFPLLAKTVEPRWDARDQFYPAFAYFSDSVREGRWPLWDPYTNCGYPFLAEPDHVTLNPVALVIASTVENAWTGFVAFWAVHWWWAGIGMLFLSWHMGGSPAGGIAAAAAYAFSGFFVGNAQHTPYITAAAWLPWIFGLADRAVATSNMGFALLAGAALGISALGGYPGLTIFTGFGLTVWLALHFIPAADPGEAGSGDGGAPGRRALRVGTVLAIVAAVSLAIWSPILNAFFTEGAGYTDRVAPVPPEVANFAAPFSLPAMFSIFFPRATLIAWNWMETDVAMANGYAGILAVPMAALWWLKGIGPRRRWAFLAFLALMFLVSLGGKAFVRTALYYVLPPTRFIKCNSLFRIYWILPLALAAGLGVTRLGERPAERGFGMKILAGWSAAVVLVALVLSRFLGSHGIPPGDHAVRLFLPPLAVLLAAGILLGARRAAEEARRHGALGVLLAIFFLADMAAHLSGNQDTVWVRTNAVRTVESLRRTGTVVAGDPGRRHPPFYFGYFNVQQVVKEPVVLGSVSLQANGFDWGLCKTRFAEVMRFAPRFWVSPGAEKIPPAEAAAAALGATGLGAPVPAFVEDVPAGLSPARAVPGAYGQVRILSYAPEVVTMEISAPGPGDAFLASTERYAAGWKAWVDGKPRDVVRTNLYFRGISVPAGAHRVTLKYEPARWLSLVLAGGTVLLAACGAAAWLLKGR